MKGKSKFEHELFWIELFSTHVYAVNAQKYNKEEATEIFIEHNVAKNEEVLPFKVCKAAVSYGFYRTDYGEVYNGWYLDYQYDGTESHWCPVWVFEWVPAKCMEYMKMKEV